MLLLSLGRLTLNKNKESKKLDTPNCILYTSKGSVPHLTPDTLRLLPFDAVKITLEHFLHVRPPPSIEFSGGIHKFLNLEEYLVLFDIRDSFNLEEAPFNTDNSISVNTNQGVKKLTQEEYVKYMNAYKPDIFISMSDDIAIPNPSLKRIKKSEGINIFGVLGGYNNLEERVRFIKEINNFNVDGFVINDFINSKNNTNDNGDEKPSKKWIDLIKESFRHLPINKPRLAYGFEKEILLGIYKGIDLFDTCYPTRLTNSGHALTFTFYNDDNDEITEEKYYIDLWDVKYRNDFAPVSDSCKCYACQNHTKAYLHHLLITHEMLATVLLMRESIDNETFTNRLKIFFNKYRPNIEINDYFEISRDELGN
nr:2252_t:CDS:2 [Entrophospora candida]